MMAQVIVWCIHLSLTTDPMQGNIDYVGLGSISHNMITIFVSPISSWKI